MEKIVQVKLGRTRTFGYFDADNVKCYKDDCVIVALKRGTEYGYIISDENAVLQGRTENVQGKVVRVATPGDLKQIENNRMKAKDAMDICVRKITDRKLGMRIVEAEYAFDSSKIIFFFTADGRVDFRGLVHDLARIFRVRIELKQIGVRDKAKIVGGLGVCGLGLCCASYLKKFHPLQIKMAKEQGLPLNPSRISGLCGRLKCCMAHEFSVYKEYAKEMPRVGEKISTPDGKGKVVDVNVLRRYVHVDFGEGRITKVAIGKNQKN